MHRFDRALALLAFLALLAAPAAALPSLDTKDLFEVTVKAKVGAQETSLTYTVLRDADSFTDFYYLPSTPFMAVRDGAPVFALLKFQDQSVEEKEKLVEGGILQFGVTLAMPDDAKPKVCSLLATELQKRAASVRSNAQAVEETWKTRQKKDKTFEPDRLARQLIEGKKAWADAADDVSAGAITLRMTPLASSSVSLYAPVGTGAGAGQMLNAQAGPTVAPANVGAEMPFSLSLARFGVNVYEALTSGGTGIPMVVQYTYKGLSAPAGFQVIVDWDATFKHFSTSEKTKVGGSFGPIGASVSVTKDKIREDLVQNKCIEIHTTADPEVCKTEEINKLLEPLLARIDQELCERMTPPVVEPASAEEAKRPSGDAGSNSIAPSLPFKFGLESSHGFAMKDVQSVKKGKEVFNFEARQVLERNSLAGGFVGIGGWPEAVRTACVTIVPRGGWESAYLVLPTVSEEVGKTGILSIDLTASVIDPDGGESQQQTSRWTAQQNGWTFSGKKRTALVFGLMELYNRYKEEAMKAKARLRLKLQFTFVTDSFTSEQTVPMFTGDFPAASPLNAIRTVNFSFDGLTFAKQSPASTLQRVKVTLRSGKRINESKWIAPADAKADLDDLVWYVDANLPVTADVRFEYKDLASGKLTRSHSWKYSGLALNQPRLDETPAYIPDSAKIESQLKLVGDKGLEGDEKLNAWGTIVRKSTGEPVIANAPDPAATKGVIPPLGTYVSLGDARQRDTWRTGPGGVPTVIPPTEDDRTVLADYLQLLLKHNGPFTAARITRIANRPIWFTWDPAFDE